MPKNVNSIVNTILKIAIQPDSLLIATLTIPASISILLSFCMGVGFTSTTSSISTTLGSFILGIITGAGLGTEWSSGTDN